jgi:hypothetical protein
MEDDIEDKSPTDFMFRMLEGANMDGVTQVLVYKRWETGEIGYESYDMRDVDILGAVKYMDIAETMNARAALTDALGDDDD